MKCVAIGDILIQTPILDAIMPSQPWVTEYESHMWAVTKARDETRHVIRRMETLGARAYIPTAEELEWVRDAEVLMTHLYCVPSELFEAAPKLKYILSCRGGLENIDL